MVRLSEAITRKVGGRKPTYSCATPSSFRAALTIHSTRPTQPLANAPTLPNKHRPSCFPTITHTWLRPSAAAAPPSHVHANHHHHRCEKVLYGHQHSFEQNLLRCAWSPDGTRVSAGSGDRIVYLWDVGACVSPCVRVSDTCV